MTGAEMLTEFRLGFDIIASGAAPGFTDAQVYSLLNRAQEYIIDELIASKQQYLLGELLRSDYNLTESFPAASNNYITAYLPDSTYDEYELWKFLSASVSVTRNGFSNTGVIKSTTGISVEKVTILTPEEFETWDKGILTTGANEGFGVNNYVRYFRPKGTIYYNSSGETIIKVRGDYYTKFNYINISYVSKPLAISDSPVQNSVLLPKVHRQIVDKAIDIAKTIINIQTPQSSNT